MSNKTYLVARREFFDMIRTKTFWFGILMFPVIWALVLVVPSLLNKAKSIREFSIIDHSEDQWISKELKKRSEFPDLLKVVEETRRRHAAGDGSANELPASLRDPRVVRAFGVLDDEKKAVVFRKKVREFQRQYPTIEMIAERLAKRLDPALMRMALGAARHVPFLGLPQDAFENVDKLDPQELTALAKRVLRAPGEIASWWRDLPAEEKQALALDAKALTQFKLIESGSNEKELSKLVGEGKLFAYFVIPKGPVGLKPAGAEVEFKVLEAKKAAAKKNEPGGNAAGKAKNGADGSTAGKGGQEKENDANSGSDTEKAKGKDEGPKSALDLAQPRFKYVTRQENLADSNLKNWFGRHAGDLLRDRRVGKLRIAKGDADWVSAGVRWDEKRATASGREEEVEKSDTFLQFAPVVFVYLLWITIFTSANFLLTNTVEEKSNRIIEVLLSSVSPQQLMVGKILGLAATGLVMVGSWAFFAYAGIKIAPLFGESIGSGVANLGLEKIVANPRYMISFIVYFLAGYLLYASVLAGIGSVCNSLKEAQNLMQPVVIFLIVPLLAMIPIAQEPNGPLAKFLTYIPLFTPFIMMNRAGGPPSSLEYLITSVLIIATIWIALKLAGKVFRIGVLMTGKPPKIREIWGWLRQPEGAVPVRKEA